MMKAGAAEALTISVGFCVDLPDLPDLRIAVPNAHQCVIPLSGR
jgi:hypothetical protein